LPFYKKKQIYVGQTFAVIGVCQVFTVRNKSRDHVRFVCLLLP